MAQLIVRNIEQDVKERLAQRARAHGHSMEEEARRILREAVGALAHTPGKSGLGTQLAQCFEGVELDEPLPEMKGQQARPVIFD